MATGEPLVFKGKLTSNNDLASEDWIYSASHTVSTSRALRLSTLDLHSKSDEAMAVGYRPALDPSQVPPVAPVSVFGMLDQS